MLLQSPPLTAFNGWAQPLRIPLLESRQEALRSRTIQDLGYGVPRIHLPRTPVNSPQAHGRAFLKCAMWRMHPALFATRILSKATSNTRERPRTHPAAKFLGAQDGGASGATAYPFMVTVGGAP